MRLVRNLPTPTSNTLRVLLLENSETDAELIAHELRRSNLRAVMERVDSEEAFTAALQSFAPDIVLSDHSLAKFDSRAALEILRSVRPTAPFIIVTGSLTDVQTVAALRAGAEDLILKASLSRLVPSISSALAVRRPLHTLTERQIEVLKLVAQGYRTRDIAGRLRLGIKTVESHRYAMMKRLRVHEVAGLVRYAIRVGLVPLEAGSRDRVGSA
jgi:DNA-binding NarL/FixJ family response regulator